MKKRTFWLMAIVSIALLVYLFKRMDIGAVCAQFGRVHLGLAVLVVALAFLDRVVMAFKWNVLVKALGIRVPYLECLRVYLVSSFVGMFFPVSVGADVIRLCMVGVEKGRREGIAASIVVERILGFLGLIALLILSSLALSFFDVSHAHLILGVAVVCLGVGAGLFWISLKGLPAAWMERLKGRLGEILRKVMSAYTAFREKRRALAVFLVLSFLQNLLPIACNYAVAVAMGFDVGFLVFCVAIPVILVFARMPISLDGLGVQEVMYVVLFSMAGLTPEESLSLGLMTRFLATLAMLPGAVLFLFSWKAPAAADGAAAPPRRVSRWVLGLAGAVLIWGSFTWPLPAHLFTGITSSDRNVETFHLRSMIAGDHLQLLYHFWLTGDMLEGRTPWFRNQYEFNTGDDSARFKPDTLFIPFSVVYAAGAWVGGKAFGWNVAGFVSIVLTLFFTWQLVRRYVREEWAACAAAFIGILFAYRWITLLTGSPTGFAMAFVPMMFLGLDLAVRQGRFWGGVLSGVTAFFSYCTDLHVFFFIVLAAPAWCVVAWAAGSDLDARKPQDWRRLAWALLPAALLMAATVCLSRLLTQYEGTDLESGRSLFDVVKRSPSLRGLVSFDNLGVSNHVFFGAVTMALAAAGGALALVRRNRDREGGTRGLVVTGLLALGILVVVSLALGIHGPFKGVLIKAAREYIPSYSMIRQPVKIYCLLPTLLAVFGGLGMAYGMAVIRQRRWALALPVLVVAAIGIEHRCKLSPTVCLIPHEQEAYRLVAEEAARAGDVPRVMIVPLWPGDSHWASLYEHYVSLYRIRMLNGYSPVKRNDYVANVFRRLESINQGVIRDDQLDALLQMGIRHLILHEDAFPQQVSPFPVTFTLERMLAHPRLELAKQVDSVWVFRIKAAADAATAPRGDAPASRHILGHREWQFELHMASREAWTAGADAAAGAGGYVSAAETPVQFFPKDIPMAPGIRFMIRARGHGVLRVGFREKDAASAIAGSEQAIKVESDAWAWHELPLAYSNDWFRGSLELRKDSGSVDLDVMTLEAGEGRRLTAPGTVVLPGKSLFHAGYSDLSDGAVVLRADWEMDKGIVYAPVLPLEAGAYAFSLETTSNAQKGTVLGRLCVEVNDKTVAEQAVRAGEPESLAYRHEHNLPIGIRFFYSRAADMRIKSLTLECRP